MGHQLPLRMTTFLCYEHPLNEKMRTFLRIEFLFQQVLQAARGRHPWESRFALDGLLDLLDLTQRMELKAELIKDLERHAMALEKFRTTPHVDQKALDNCLTQLSQVIDPLLRVSTTDIDDVRHIEFLTALRQRRHIAGGDCTFDLPGLHYWLQQLADIRTKTIHEWLNPLQPIYDSVALILQLIRDRATVQPMCANRGFFQKQLDSASPPLLIRILLPQEANVFPAISAGRHRFAIQFLTQPDPTYRATQTTEDVAFWIAYGTL